MKNTLFALLLLLPGVPMFGATKPNPADFTLKVHVVSVGQELFYNGTYVIYQRLEVVLDNQQLQLQSGPNAFGLLPLGDYPAQIDPRVSAPKYDSVDVFRGYVLLMPDGSTRRYTLTRIGPAPSRP